MERVVLIAGGVRQGHRDLRLPDTVGGTRPDLTTTGRGRSALEHPGAERIAPEIRAEPRRVPTLAAIERQIHAIDAMTGIPGDAADDDPAIPGCRHVRDQRIDGDLGDRCALTRLL